MSDSEQSESTAQLTLDSLPQGEDLGDKKLYVVDGSSYIYRAFYAIRGLSTSDGLPTNAIYGFTRMLQKLIEDEEPDFLAVTFDAHGADEKTFRKEMFPEYKAHRKEMPDDLQTQLPYFHRIVQALNIPILEEPTVEADDLIATMTDKARSIGLPVCVVTGDKDLMQLVGDDVEMYDTMKDKRYDIDDVVERFNVEPQGVKYVLALSGDSSDNIPGVPGIGEITGGKLIDEFGDLETILANIEDVGGKKRKQNLREYADQARLSLELVTLKNDCSVAFDLEQLELTAPNFEALTALFYELEFDSILDELNGWYKEQGWIDDETLRELSERFEDQGMTTADSDEKDYRAIYSLDEVDDVVDACRDADLFAFDLETTSLDPMDADIVGMSFSWQPDQAVYIPTGHDDPQAPEQLDLDDVLERVTPLLEDRTPKKVAQHYKYEWLVLQSYDIEFAGVAHDTMLMSYLLEPGNNSHSLDAIALDHLNHSTTTFSDVAGSGASQKRFDEVPVDEATPYACEDADITLMACRVLAEQLEDDDKLVDLERDLEIPLSRILGIMERRGIGVDRDILDEMSRQFDAELDELKADIAEYAGEEVNPNSPKQLRKVLFDKLGLPVKKRTKTGPSTARSVLEQLEDEHPLPGLILEYRSFAKLKGTYVDALPDLIHEETGRIHSDFNQAVTATGRLSSSNPNLQNIPIRTERGRQIRGAFVADDGHLLLAADYSQIELRLMAHLSGDEALVEAYRDGKDIHSFTASQIFDVDLADVTAEQRRAGKTVNFGVMYGMGSRRLARDLEISTSEAKSYIDEYFARYEGVSEYFDELVDNARQTGYARTMFGRRRHLPNLDSGGRQKAYAERAAINTPIQGTAADIIKFAMVEMQRKIEAEDLPYDMLLQVHDELIFEVPEEDIERAESIVCDVMEGVCELDVPLVVDAGVGPSWLDAK